ncbi:hypothetical protein RCL_jg8504.t1 [Rhizophagus clarus]|uniref:Uncharacterized protein n=1 Tax=Rhizophagus clarus TaxID=94130 RepID=A0A8H3R567_9GLOM|nr:hypothetical protein RCL_jg8504.t1 [Rhizophagus clarus]
MCNICSHPNHKYAECPDKDKIGPFCRPRASNIIPLDTKARLYLTNSKYSVSYNKKPQLMIPQQQNTPYNNFQYRSRSSTRKNLSHFAQPKLNALIWDNLQAHNTYHFAETQNKNNNAIIQQLKDEVEHMKIAIKKNKQEIERHTKCIQDLNKVSEQITKSITKISSTLESLTTNQHKVTSIELTQ